MPITISTAEGYFKEIYGDKVRLQPMGQKRGLLSRLGVNMAEDMLSTVEERAMRAHFGM